MSSSNKNVMSLEEKVRIIHMYKVRTRRSEKRGFRLLYPQIIKDKNKILARYEAMKKKLAAVRDLVITEYGKPSYIGEKRAFLEKIISEWYQRAKALLEIKQITLALVGHKIDIAMRILNITDLPLSESQLCYLRGMCQKASLERKSKFESTTLSLKKIARELLVKMGLSKAKAISMFGPNIFEEPDDDEDDVEFVRKTHHVRRKLKQQEQPPLKTPRTSNAEVRSLVTDLEQDWTEVESETDSEEEPSDSDSDANSAQSSDLPYEGEVNEHNQSEEEDIELYDVISVEDSTEEFDAASSSKNIIPDSLIKKEEKDKCETSIDGCEEGVAPLIKVEPDEGQSGTNALERVEECIKKECEAKDEKCGNIKIESEEVNCDSVPTTTYFEDYEEQGVEIESSDLDGDRLVHLYTLASEDSSDADSASQSMENGRSVENNEDVMHILELLKAYLRKERNDRALEALNKVEAAFP